VAISLRIRPADPGDAPTLAELHPHVHGLHVAARPDFFKEARREDVAAWFREQLARSEVRMWLGEVDAAPAGYTLVYFHERPERPFAHARRWCEIDQIAVAPAGRRRGVARALVEAALKEARRRGIRDIELSSWAFNTAAHEVFLRLGFTPKVIRFERFLPA
jgi:GNAT superfamily N-acetyltransferase